MGATMAEKVWDEHVVRHAEGEPDLIYVDMHLVHEVTSPQAFDGLRLAGRPVRRPDLTIATEDHNVPTTDIDQPIADPVSRTQVDALERSAVTAPSRSERRRLYAQIERKVADAVPIVYLFNPSYSYAYRTALRGFSPNGFDPTWDAYRWSLAAP